jgi:hypothetical protein
MKRDDGEVLYDNCYGNGRKGKIIGRYLWAEFGMLWKKLFSVGMHHGVSVFSCMHCSARYD